MEFQELRNLQHKKYMYLYMTLNEIKSMFLGPIVLVFSEYYK
jgi:hypothetical protein